MANKKTNKFAAMDTAAKEVKEAPVQNAPAETVKAEEKAPAPAETKSEMNTKSTVKSAAKKAEPKTEEAAAVSENLVIEFSGSNYGSSDIIQKCKDAFAADHPEEKLSGIEVYINVSERRAYYVANGNAEGKYIEL